jgi:hypothetical protein
MNPTNFLMVGLVALSTSVAACAASEPAGNTTGEEQALTALPSGSIPFDGPTPSSEVRLGGHAERQGPASVRIDGVLDAMTKLSANQNVLFLAGMYRVDAEVLATFARTGAAQQAIAYDVMFRVDGSKAGTKTGLGFQSKLEPSETLGCESIDTRSALAVYTQTRAFDAVHGDDSLTAAQKRTLDADAAVVVDSLLAASRPSKLVQCTWSNNDDTDATALVTVDEGSGVVRVLLAWAGG